MPRPLRTVVHTSTAVRSWLKEHNEMHQAVQFKHSIHSITHHKHISSEFMLLEPGAASVMWKGNDLNMAGPLVLLVLSNGPKFI